MIGQVRRFTRAAAGAMGTYLDPKKGMVAHEFNCVESKKELRIHFEWDWGGKSGKKIHILHTVEKYRSKDNGMDIWVGFAYDGATLMIPKYRRDAVIFAMGGWK